MADDLIDLYLGPSSGKAKPNGDMNLIDQYLAPSKTPVAPIREDSGTPRTIEDITGRASKPEYQPSPPSQSGYMQSVGEISQGAINLMRSGGEDISQGRPATGVGKIGLGGIAYPLSPITGGLHEYVGKPATAIGGPEFGEKAEMLAGSALPLGVGGRAITKRLPTNAALEAITSSVTPAELAEGLQRLKSNPRLSVLDVFPSVRQMGQKLITTEGTHQNQFEKFVNDRIGGRKDAIEDIFHETTGTPPNVLIKINELKQNIKDAGKEINPIVETANPVDTSNVIKSIDSILKPGVTSVISMGKSLPLGDVEKELETVRKLLTDDKSVRTDAGQLHALQSALRAEAENLLHSATGKDKRIGYALMDVRNQLVDAIENSAPGYKKALGKYRDENQVDEAFKKGYLVLRNKAGNWEDRPEFWDQWIKDASKEEREAAREGARVAFNDNINGTRFNGRKGMEIPETPFNREKLEMLFGKREVNEMATRLRDERDIADVNQKLTGNSQTAMRMKADKKVDLPERKDGGITAQLALLAEAAGQYTTGGVPGLGALVMAPKIAGIAKHKFVDLPLAMKKNERLTDLMTATGSKRDELIKMLEASLPQAKLTSGQKLQLMIGKP